MADEVPVRDVLCEAMEYLSKLGTNLRTRSESLKEKRISKEKLKNTHAIQKAAQKVLLICELSKKSLDNVEKGVKNIMSAVDASQASTSVGAKTSSFKSSQSKPKYHHFVYGSRKLRIIKKIPLKHYLSLKVMARRMPNSMQDNYPVYYDCKLYRLRAKGNLENKSDKIKHHKSTLESHSKSSAESDSENYSVKNKSKDESNRTKSLEKRSPSPVKKRKSRSSSVDNLDENDQNTNKTVEDNTITNDKNKHDSDDDQRDEKSISNTSKLEQQNKKSKLTKKKRDNIEDLDVNSTHDSEMKQQSTENKGTLSEDGEALDSENAKLEETSNKKSELNNIKDSQKNLSEMDETNKNESKKELTHGFESSDDDININNKDKQEKEVKHSKYKRFKNDKLVKDISESEENCDKEENLTSKEAEKKSEQVDSDEEVKNTQKDNSGDEHLSNNGINKQSDIINSQTEVKKPLIKCVNISKLLKPDLTNETSPVENKFSKYIKKSRTNLKTKKESIRSDNILEKSAKNMKIEDEYWEQKRKEVSAFKPKKFVINLARMPRFSKEFMDKHVLKKIICKGTIIFEVISDVVSENDESNNISKKKHINKPLNINQIKSSLLNDSDSEISEVEKVNNALLNESDSDIHSKEYNKGCGSQSIEKLNDGTVDNPGDNKTSECMEQNGEQNKHLLRAHSGSDYSDKAPKKEVSKEPDEIKSSLLNSVDKLSKTPNKRRRNSEGHTPQSKRKHIMESMHAKKMLLTYSSSSDTDDEQLRSALKEIKNSLLKGISSSDEDVVDKKSEEHCKKLFTSSDSDEDILHKIKKQRKLSKTKNGKKKYKTMKDDDADSKNTGNSNEHSDCSSSKVRSS